MLAMSMELNDVLRHAAEVGATDVHFKLGQPPVLRSDGALAPANVFPALGENDLTSILDAVTIAAPRRRDAFDETGELDIAYAASDLPRFRVNGFRQRGAISFAFRRVPAAIAGFEELGLPEGVERLAGEPRGLVLVTGATGSGKTTTLAAVVDYINRSRAQHIVTIEDPIEFLHADKRCIVNQREIGVDTDSFGQALRRVLRQDPVVILIGELSHAETAHVALQAAESGHLVLSTLHTIDAAETLSRLIEFFPPEKQPQIVSVLAGSLRGVISQRLLPRVGGGRIPAVEVMVVNARVAELIRERRGDSIPQAIEDGEYFSMQSFAQALIRLVLDGLVEREVAANAATNQHDFLIALERAEKAAHVARENAKTAAQAVAEVAAEETGPSLRIAGA